ncbi:MAG: polysaccharide biosynthesis tyrosine autokinase, partial [Armatimonadota bacterium]|nr:polysaccharide biosynthesis tyrosine autokinase [Armatimonadota bacterium]
FCDFYDRVSHREATENRKFLEEQLHEARRKLDLADEKLRSFRGRARIANLNTQIEADLKVLAELKSERDSAVAQLSEVAGNLAAVSRQIAHMNNSKTTVEMTSEGSPTTDLKARIAQMEKDLALLRSRYTPKHPKIVQLETTLARARDELNRTPNLMTQRVVITANPEYEALQSKKRDLEAQRAAGQARVAALDRAIREREEQLSKYPATDVELSRLALESKTAQEAYSSILARWNQARIDESLTTETGAIQIIDRAEKANGPIRKGPDQIQLIIASILFGIAIGAGYSLLTEKLDVSIRTVEDARSLVDLPIVGVIPTLEPAISPIDAPRLTDLNPISPYSESYRFLGTDLLLSAEQEGIKSIMVATAKPHQGGTVTICNLAITLAQAGKQVVLVDADFRRPQLHRVFSVANKPGLSDALSNGMPISDTLQPTNIPNLKLIPSGTNPDNPWKLLRSQKFVEIIDELKAAHDFVLLDSPSAMVFADAITMSSVVDGVLVVIRANQPPRGNELQLKHLLNKANANIIGVVLNAVSPHLTDSICFHDYYYSTPLQGKSRLSITGGSSNKNTALDTLNDENKQV